MPACRRQGAVVLPLVSLELLLLAGFAGGGPANLGQARVCICSENIVPHQLVVKLNIQNCPYVFNW